MRGGPPRGGFDHTPGDRCRRRLARWADHEGRRFWVSRQHRRVYQRIVIDTYAKVAFAKLYDRKTPITAAEILND